MPVGNKEVTPEEGTEIANRVGLNSVNWNGSMLTLVLLDGSAIELKQSKDGASADSPFFICTHRTLRINRTPTEQY